MNAKPLLAALSCALVICACSSPPTSAPATASAPPISLLRSGVYGQNLDRAVRPQDDFYRFVNGQWLTNASIPADRSNYGAFALLEDGAEKNLKDILEEAAGAYASIGSERQKVGDLYASYLDEATIELRGLTP